MAIIKCKMCGGDIELTADKTFGTCEYCGCSMTLPKVDDDQRAAAFNRGNHFRRIGEFDKALTVYERIVREDDTDAEAHWCCALCRFGIEYVEDPATYEWLPTCHRASFDSFLEDVDYKAALEYSDGITRRQYMKDGVKIAEVQRGILATSQNTEPYDVFICYKESDENGNRTRDSLMAQDIYYQLTEQGRKVFFARITLEDVAGTQYEPYIFAALNSAKVMIVVGTKPEHLNAVWVKNEWSRFLSMMKKDRHKLLLPCYRDMDPYDMPEALSVLQSYDMAKIGFIQDLTRGIAKVLDADKKPAAVKETVVVQQSGSGANTAALLKRAFMFLEDGDWESANTYCEKVLDIDPEHAYAYLGKLMVDLRVRNHKQIANHNREIGTNNNFQKALRFGNENFKAVLLGYSRQIVDRLENERCERIYQKACAEMNASLSEEAQNSAAEMFASILEYKDAAEKRKTCLERIVQYRRACERKAEEARQEAEAQRKTEIYDHGVRLMEHNAIPLYKQAIEQFEQIPGWKDADDLIPYCKRQIATLKKQEEAAAKRTKRIIAIGIPIICVAAAILIIWTTVIVPNNQYNDAIALMEAGNYNEAITIFTELEDYNDSAERVKEAKYAKAGTLAEAGDYAQAADIYKDLGEYKDSQAQTKEAKYQYVKADMSRANTITHAFLKDLKSAEYKDSADIFKELYAWKAEIIAINSDPDDENTNKTSISRYDPVYFHIKVTGGEPGAEVPLTGKIIYPDGDATITKWDWAANDGKIFWVGWDTGIYGDPENGTRGTLKIQIYDENERVIGEGSVEIT